MSYCGGTYMRRGRPSDGYAREEFRELVVNRREFLGLSLAALAELARVNRGTLSQVLNGRRPCGKIDRAALIRALGLGKDAEEQYLATSPIHAGKSDLILLDPHTSSHPPLDQGQRHLICAMYPDANREFIDVYRSAASNADLVLQADAAARLAWMYFEMGVIEDSIKWISKCVRLIEKYVGAPLDEIIESVRPGAHSAIFTITEEASHVLSRALHLRCKLLVEKITYYQEFELRREADIAFSQSLTLDEHLQIPAQLGHDLRWKAVMIASGVERSGKDADKLISASREKSHRGSLGRAYVLRDEGIVCWQTERYTRARNSLLESVDALSSFADSRALGPAFCALSQVISQGGGDLRVARRYALAGGVLHPHSFVLANAKRQFQGVSEAGLRRDINDLFEGTRPFDVLSPVMSRLTNGPSKNVYHRMQENLTRVLGPKFSAIAV